VQKTTNILHNLYEVPKRKLKGPVVLDLGCSVGYESLKMFQVFCPSKLISVDPFIENTNRTQDLIIGGSKTRIWTTQCCAVGERRGEKNFYFSFSPHTNNFPCGGINPPPAESKEEFLTRSVEVKRLPDIHPKPDILKVDIEGQEWLIWDQLLGMPTIKIMILELHGNKDTELNQRSWSKKILQLKRYFTIRWFVYAQSQTAGYDWATETGEHIFNGKEGNVCHIVCERKYINE